MNKLPIDITGLSAEQVLASRKQYGTNEISGREKSPWLEALIETIKEPMFILLLVASILYFISGQESEGIFMVSAIVLVAAISLYQDSRSRNALASLKNLSQPKTSVVRNKKRQVIPGKEIVTGDVMIIEEGSLVNADATIIYSNDFAVNESILTGESMPVIKNKDENNNQVFQGTMISSGMAIAVVTAVGNATQLGRIGQSLKDISEEQTPLQVQIGNFVKKMAVAGLLVFILVWGINYFQSRQLLESLLKALTLAMSVLPEEIPVAFTTFMALGAWRLMKMGVIVKQVKTVETLGSATVICTDKTGTITENKMQLAELYVHRQQKLFKQEEISEEQVKELITIAMWASEPLPFDPMEKALHSAYQKIAASDERLLYKMIHEYPLSGKPPMMTHIFADQSGNRIIAAKGAPEKIIDCCKLSPQDKELVNRQLLQLAQKGYRVLGVAKASFEGDIFPEDQETFNFEFIGFVSFYDPPKKNIQSVFTRFYKAGIQVKIITGDNKATTMHIASQVNFKGQDTALDGDELLQLTIPDFEKRVMDTNIFTRMFPDAKLKIINALKQNGQIVAMTGDGVNDGPALKAAHIAIAMGKKGSEIAKNASSLILADDDLEKMVDAIAMGRRIYSNLKKAIQYIISIHIPIILTVLLPLVFGWIYPAIFTPVHVIFLELIMGPTCSIIYENEPIEKNLMQQAPRPFSSSFLSWKELNISIWQGLAITAATLFIYQFGVINHYNENLTRTLVFTTLLAANIFLTMVNRSFYYSVISTFRYKNNLMTGILLLTIVLTAIMLYIPVIASFFKLEAPAGKQLLLCIVTGFVAVIWLELLKYFKRRKTI